MNIDAISSSGAVQKIKPEGTVTRKVIHNEKKAIRLPKAPDKETIRRTLDNITQNTRFSYTVTDEIGRYIIKIIDRNTDRVIKQIPAEELQALHENIQEAIGLLFDKEI